MWLLLLHVLQCSCTWNFSFARRLTGAEERVVTTRPVSCCIPQIHIEPTVVAKAPGESQACDAQRRGLSMYLLSIET